MITHEGSTFLSLITHLVLWIPPTDVLLDTEETVIPGWIRDVPFSSMSNLTHFAFPLVPRPINPPRPRNQIGVLSITLLAYTAPPEPDPSFTAETFALWALGDNPLAKGTTISGFEVNWVGNSISCWDQWSRMQMDCIWEQLDRIRATG